MLKLLSKYLDGNERQLNSLIPYIAKINSLEEKYEKISNSQIREKTQEFRKIIQDSVDSDSALEELLPDAYALVREASKRALKQRHFNAQLMAGIVLHKGKIAEQKTGEGKTLTATLPLYLNSLTGRGCHLVTPNDYLSRHGAGWMGPIYDLLGVSVGIISQNNASFIYDPAFENTKFLDDYAKHLRPAEKRQAYECDITYGTNDEFGFDYLRDNLAYDIKELVQSGYNFAIVDEVDSILIDEARTPLIISAPAGDSTKRYYQFAEIAQKLTPDVDYKVDEKYRSASLTELGISKIERIIGVPNLYESDFETVHHVENAIRARSLFTKDKDYVVKDSQVIIVDEFTGRLMPGRRWSEGLHQAIEAKEGAEIQKESRTFATVSFQNYFRLYKKLAGMTGTAVTEAEEFSKIYKLDVVVIPSNEPLARKDLPDVVYKTKAAKYRAIVKDIERAHSTGQPVLVGTTSIENNELLASLLKRKNVTHELLNAKQHEREALIIAQAGRKGAVTIATNMAGRGVDIKLGGDPQEKEEFKEVKSLGGLYVIGTERHESRRIDNQLRGRSGRQGEPGRSKFFVSLQDDLMRIFGGEQVEKIMDRFGMDENIPIEAGLVSKALENSQKKVETLNFDRRKNLVDFDDVMNKHREVIYKLRQKILWLSSSEEKAKESKEWFLERVLKYYGDAREIFEQREKDLKNVWYEVLKRISLQVVDTYWMEHLDSMDSVREGIGLRAYGQKDPLVEYKQEGHRMFGKLVVTIWSTIGDRLSRVQVEQMPKTEIQKPIVQDQRLIHEEHNYGVRDEAEMLSQSQKTVMKSANEKVGRNALCPCGSGKKYKRCHGS
ncbi:MAG: preprotein translocase subunit SecA [Patescibacteria group bacterium]|nr:preprotein translocase subunit SecA [Patescibacteria group bacterium]